MTARVNTCDTCDKRRAVQSYWGVGVFCYDCAPVERRSDTNRPRAFATSMYRDDDRLVLRRACYGEIAVHQEGHGRSVYLARREAVRFAWALLRAAAVRR